MDGEVSRKTFDRLDDQSKLGVLFDRSEHMLEQDQEILKRLDSIDKRLHKQAFWGKIYSAIGGFCGGIVSSVSMFIYWGTK